MKKNYIQRFFSLSAVAALAAGCDDTKNGFELKGKFENGNGKTIYLEKLASTRPVTVDSAVVGEDGTFEFIGYTPSIGFYRLLHNQQNFAMLVLDSADKVKVTGNLNDLGNTYKVDGSPETRLFMEYNDIARKRDTRLDSLNKEWEIAMGKAGMNEKVTDSLSAIFEKPYNAIVDASNAQMADKIRANSNRYASIMAIQSLDPDRYAGIYHVLDSGLMTRYSHDRNVKMFHDIVQKMKATTIGQEAPEIELPSSDGNNIKLSGLRGKVVLIDFWASWCGPCRREMPNVVQAYNKYKDKGFEILGVSLDRDRDKWLEAIRSDGMTWPQVSDLKYFDSEAARLYNVQAIPYTVLLDREGKIIAKNLRGENLDEKLAEVLQ